MKNPVNILVTSYSFLYLHIATQVHVYGHKTTTLEVHIMVYIFKTTLYIDKYHSNTKITRNYYHLLQTTGASCAQV